MPACTKSPNLPGDNNPTGPAVKNVWHLGRILPKRFLFCFAFYETFCNVNNRQNSCKTEVCRAKKKTIDERRRVAVVCDGLGPRDVDSLAGEPASCTPAATTGREHGCRGVGGAWPRLALGHPGTTPNSNHQPTWLTSLLACSRWCMGVRRWCGCPRPRPPDATTPSPSKSRAVGTRKTKEEEKRKHHREREREVADTLQCTFARSSQCQHAGQT